MKLYAKTGGYKEVLDQSKNRVLKTQFTGTELYQQVRVVFDLEPPTHCSKDNSCDDDDWGFTLHVEPDVTDVSNAFGTLS